MASGIRLANLKQSLESILKHRLNALRDRHGALGDAGDEVRQAGDDADVGLLAHGLQRIRENLKMATRDELGSLDGGTCTATRLIDVSTDVGVTKKRMDSNLGHPEVEDQEISSKVFFFRLFFQCVQN